MIVLLLCNITLFIIEVITSGIFHDCIPVSGRLMPGGARWGVARRRAGGLAECWRGKIGRRVLYTTLLPPRCLLFSSALGLPPRKIFTPFPTFQVHFKHGGKL